MTRYYNVKFNNSSNTYSFKSDLELQKDAIVVCETQRGLAVGTILAEVKYTELATQWIVCEVDMVTHMKRLEKATKLEAIMAQMLARKRQVEERAIYEMLAEKDDELKKLLEVYNDLMK